MGRDQKFQYRSTILLGISKPKMAVKTYSINIVKDPTGSNLLRSTKESLIVNKLRVNCKELMYLITTIMLYNVREIQHHRMIEAPIYLLVKDPQLTWKIPPITYDGEGKDYIL